MKVRRAQILTLFHQHILSKRAGGVKSLSESDISIVRSTNALFDWSGHVTYFRCNQFLQKEVMWPACGSSKPLSLRCCFQTPCSISIAKTQQIIPCLPHFLLLNEHSSRSDEILPRLCHVEFENKAARGCGIFSTVHRITSPDHLAVTRQNFRISNGWRLGPLPKNGHHLWRSVMDKKFQVTK